MTKIENNLVEDPFYQKLQELEKQEVSGRKFMMLEEEVKRPNGIQKDSTETKMGWERNPASDWWPRLPASRLNPTKIDRPAENPVPYLPSHIPIIDYFSWPKAVEETKAKIEDVVIKGIKFSKEEIEGLMGMVTGSSKKNKLLDP